MLQRHGILNRYFSLKNFILVKFSYKGCPKILAIFQFWDTLKMLRRVYRSCSFVTKIITNRYWIKNLKFILPFKSNQKHRVYKWLVVLRLLNDIELHCFLYRSVSITSQRQAALAVLNEKILFKIFNQVRAGNDFHTLTQ